MDDQALQEYYAKSIVVQFVDGWKYKHTSHSAGAETIARMHRLAVAARGLGGFIAKHVREACARKFR